MFFFYKIFNFCFIVLSGHAIGANMLGAGTRSTLRSVQDFSGMDIGSIVLGTFGGLSGIIAVVAIIVVASFSCCR